MIDADHRAKEAQAQRVTTNRVQAVTATFAAVRARLTTTVTQAAAAFGDKVTAGQALLVATVTTVAATALTLLSGAVTALTARVAQSIGVVAGLVAGAINAAQAGVSSVIGMITGLIDAVPLPDVPGVATIRAGAVAFLAGACGVLTATLNAVASGVRAAAAAAVAVVATLLSRAMVLVRSAVSRIVSGLMRLVRTVTNLLLRLAAGVVAALRLVLSSIVLPLLRRVELIVVGRLRWVLGHALRLLRRNREQQLATLTELEGSLPPPRSGTTADPLDPEAAADAARVVADAVTNSNRVVRLLDTLTGGIVRTVSGLVRDVVVLVLSDIRRRLARAVVRLLQLVAMVRTAVRRTAAVVAEMLRSMVAQVVQGILGIIETVRQLVQRPLDTVISVAATAVTRVLQAVTAFVADLVLGVLGVSRDIRAIVLGEASAEVAQPAASVSASPTSPSARFAPATAPVLVPAAGGVLVVVAGALAWAAELFAPVVVFFVVAYVALESALVAGVTSLAAFLIGLGFSPFWAGVVIVLLIAFVVVVIVVIAVVMIILLFLLVLTVLRALQRSRRRRRDRKRVLSVNPGRPEVGVGGPPLPISATIAPGIPPVPPLAWTVNPDGAVPDGISIVGVGMSVQARADHPAHGVVTGGVPVVVRAALISDPLDCADSPGIMVVQVVAARYDADPPLEAVSAGLGRPPVNTVDPNRNGVFGSTARVAATTEPEGRPVDVILRAPLDATVTGTTIKPGEQTGDIDVRIFEQVTGATLDATRPSPLDPALAMSILVVNAVPTSVTRISSLRLVEGSPYGFWHKLEFASSDSHHPPLVRIVGELVTDAGDDFGIDPPNKEAGGFNNEFHRDLAGEAHLLGDKLRTHYKVKRTKPEKGPELGDALDVNRFLGLGAPGLPCHLRYRQRLVWAAWRTGEVVSRAFVDGHQLKTLRESGSTFRFDTQQVLGVASLTQSQDYIGNRLIELSNIVVTPDDQGATALAADGVSTGSAVVQTTRPGLFVRWTAPGGGVVVIAGNPSTPPEAATIGAVTQDGVFELLAQDWIYGNRQVEGKVRVAPVVLHHMSATQSGQTATVRVTADPGGRRLLWSVDASAVAAGFLVTPSRTGPGPPQMWVTVVGPAGFTGEVVVCVRDRELPGAVAQATIRFP